MALIDNSQPHQVSVPVMANDLSQAQKKAQHLATLSNLSDKTLKLLAEKSTKKGIEEKLQKFKNMI